jgi:SAM-dependent methyltransferase
MSFDRWLTRVPWHRSRKWPPRVGAVRAGDLGSAIPVSEDFGFERGTPVDRYFIEAFLGRHASDVAGCVLEVGDDAYSKRFGQGQVSEQDVLDVTAANPRATIVSDLSRPNALPENSYDCIILTQVLHLLFDLNAATENLHRALRPGGVLLLTAPGISQIDRGGARDHWYWSFTRICLERLFGKLFLADDLEVQAVGNVYACVNFLHGLALEEVDQAKLDHLDPAFPIIVTLRARKAWA